MKTVLCSNGEILLKQKMPLHVEAALGEEKPEEEPVRGNLSTAP